MVHDNLWIPEKAEIMPQPKRVKKQNSPDKGADSEAEQKKKKEAKKALYLTRV